MESNTVNFSETTLRRHAWRSGLRLSAKGGLYDLLKYNDSIDMWQPIGWRWADADWNLTAGCVQEILNELR